ncbi:MAG: VWA domain-containing protein [Bifidobacteriaceae bacterium]|jgi:uncharacterized protein YegL|nr:VWA domain-containing protein [Bifidobacteriaceae bacterium]
MATDQIAQKGDVLCAVYMLCDTSESMDGEPIRELNSLLSELVDKIQLEGKRGQDLRLGVISFNSAPKVELELQKLTAESTIPELTAAGTTRLELAIDKLAEVVESDYGKIKTAGAKAARPVVFVITDGVPTDADGYPLQDHSVWEDALERLWNVGQVAVPRIYAFGFGNADESVLRKLTSDRGVAVDAVKMATGADTANEIARIFPYLFRTIIAGADAVSNADGDVPDLGPALLSVFSPPSDSVDLSAW